MAEKELSFRQQLEQQRGQTKQESAQTVERHNAMLADLRTENTALQAQISQMELLVAEHSMAHNENSAAAADMQRKLDEADVRATELQREVAALRRRFGHRHPINNGPPK